ncbi:MAG: hypothetical protein ACYC8T_33330 [Myxococcaceae bacterium]
MDAALRRTVEALFDSSQVAWSFTRPDPGAEPGAHEIWVGVGSRGDKDPPHPRLLAWKLPQWRKVNTRSSTEAVLHSAEALDEVGRSLKAAAGALEKPLSLRTHEPTLDTLTATLLGVHRVLWGVWPAAAAELSEFVSEWEQGRIEGAGTYQRSLASVFYATMVLLRSEGDKGSREAVELLGSVLGKGLSRTGLAELPSELIPLRVARRLKADTDMYRAELSRAQRVQLDLPLEGSAESRPRRVDAMFLSSAQDVTVLKLLSRPDTEHSSYGQGFDLLAVHAPNERNAYMRHTISLAPERSGTLDNVAALLDGLEGESTPDGKPRVRGKARFPNQPNDFTDPWYSDGYAWPRGRSTIVAPPFVGTRLSREQIWETLWDRFNVGRNIVVTQALTVLVRPFRLERRLEPSGLEADGWKRSPPSDEAGALLPPVALSFLGNPDGDVEHLAIDSGEDRVHLALYPNQLALVWLERVTSAPANLFELALSQSARCHQTSLEGWPALAKLAGGLKPLIPDRWLVYGAYRVDRAHSSMLDGSRSVTGLFHALASGAPPTLSQLPSDEACAARKVSRDSSGDIEHWFTSTGGARVELVLDSAAPRPLSVDHDFLLFLLTTGQRYSVFEINRRMAELERRSRVSRWQSLRPGGDVRGDVMFFTNSLWYSRVSDDPAVNERYRAWNELHDMKDTVDTMRDQTSELDEYRKERFEKMFGLMVFVFLPITIACGFFSGIQFEEMPLRKGLPWSTGGWIIFLIYTAFFTVVTFGTVILGRLLSWRKR